VKTVGTKKKETVEAMSLYPAICNSPENSGDDKDDDDDDDDDAASAACSSSHSLASGIKSSGASSSSSSSSSSSDSSSDSGSDMSDIVHKLEVADARVDTPAFAVPLAASLVPILNPASALDNLHFAHAGVVGVDIAASGRSRCCFCEHVIPKGALRLKYAPKCTGFVSSMHRDCVTGVPVALRPNSIKALTDLLGYADPGETEMQDALSSAIRMLQG
jgi:hypothetical protein